MSILGQQHSDPVAPAQRAATQIKRGTSQLAVVIDRDWNRAFDAIWNNPRVAPADVLAALGTDAADIFALSAETVTFMLTFLAMDGGEWALQRKAAIEAKLAARPAITTHPDGTVTVD